MFQSALRSIKDDFSRSLFYWLTFVLTSMFMFLFFNLSYSDMIGVTFIHARNDMSTFTTVLVIGICMIVIFFANDFYVKKKSKELAVRLVCGGTYFQITQYLLFQTGVLFILAIPFGIGLAILFIPSINYMLMSFLNSSAQLHIQWNAIVSTTIIIVFEIFWCTLLNLGYAYRSSIKTLMYDEKTIIHFSIPLPFNISSKIKKFLSIIMFIGPIVIFYFNGDNPNSMLILSIIGMIGLYCSIDQVVVPFLNYLTQYKYVSYHKRIVYLGFLRNDILMMKKNIILLIVSSVLLLSILVSCLEQPMEVMLAMISFVVINILLALSVMFKFSTEMLGRQRIFYSLERIGYMKNVQKDILMKEVWSLYGFIGGVSLFYIVNIFIVLWLYQLLNIYLLIGMCIVFVVPLILCAIASQIYYQRLILKED